MALAADLRTLADRSVAALLLGHDYYVHTKVVWRLAEKTVQAGRRFTVRNNFTGTVVDQDALVGRTQVYTAEYLTSFTFQQFVSHFEDFVFDLIGLWLTAHPQSLAAKTIPFGAVMDAPDKDAITRIVVDEELNGLKYKRIPEWFRYLDKLVHLDVPSADEVESLAEIKASRDILVHNKGVVNAVYVSKSGGRARYTIGQRLEVTDDYHWESWSLILKVIQDVAAAAIERT
jgi:hypothetical protein